LKVKSIYNNKSTITCQIALGVGDISANPDLWNIMEYTREQGIIPNITTNGMGITREIAQRLANVCGAVSVSRYHIPDVCYDAVKKINDATLNTRVKVRRRKK
jgi:MoaA/NifB/PqqE/SkfB family radical SAM enzyme